MNGTRNFETRIQSLADYNCGTSLRCHQQGERWNTSATFIEEIHTVMIFFQTHFSQLNDLSLEVKLH